MDKGPPKGSCQVPGGRSRATAVPRDCRAIMGKVRCMLLNFVPGQHISVRPSPYREGLARVVG